MRLKVRRELRDKSRKQARHGGYLSYTWQREWRGESDKPIKKLEWSHVTKISFWNQESTYELTEIARWLLHNYLDTSKSLDQEFFSKQKVWVTINV